MKSLVETLSENPVETVAIFSALVDKNIVDMIELASGSIKHWYLVPIKAERSIEPKALKEKFVNSGPTTVCLNMRSAIEQSLKLEGVNRVVIFGSFYTIAAASKIIKKI